MQPGLSIQAVKRKDNEVPLFEGGVRKGSAFFPTLHIVVQVFEKRVSFSAEAVEKPQIGPFFDFLWLVTY